ncbi:MAG: S-layer homology domain-containing protein [Clostridiales bacterium]|nr:S-layer homology domain-containing protein [Clostridiales bacterium]
MKKRLPALFLALALCLALLPAPTFASGTQESVTVGGMTFSEVLTTSYYDSLGDFYRAEGETTEPGNDFNYALGTQMLWWNEDPSTPENEFVGIRTFWCFFLPPDASITFRMAKGDVVYYHGWNAEYYQRRSSDGEHFWKTEVVEDKSRLFTVDAPGDYVQTKADFEEYIPEEFNMLTLEMGDTFVQLWFVDQIPVPPFTDTPAWCANEAQWAVEKGITNGYGGSATFAPGIQCPNTQILTFLWRAADEPDAAAEAPFTVASYYQDAVNWAYEKGLIDDSFDPDAPCTRSQAVWYIWKALGETEAAEAASFSDVDADAPYADAVSWALEKGVTTGSGDGDNTFAPDRVCTRGEIAAFLYRAYNN